MIFYLINYYILLIYITNYGNREIVLCNINDNPNNINIIKRILVFKFYKHYYDCKYIIIYFNYLS